MEPASSGFAKTAPLTLGGDRAWRSRECRGASGNLTEINTKEVAQRITAELKRYSIPQAIFAQRILCRSQGTLSDLLRNPKPWSKLKSGRETFRRMWKWLQEPEFQRMSALRLAAKGAFSALVELVSPDSIVPCLSGSPKHRSRNS
ncbi:One cut domain family member 2 [Fukomys damarensis]|uniref:One cut domain family member 2 n=1 Tax=Fukomys damarensis TaxID=885580 RepID=A0A091DEG7_FUKDA|nr:One cut domain family member 2 [Fukomys damarensis]